MLLLQFFIFLHFVNVQNAVEICSIMDKNQCLDMTEDEYEQWQQPMYEDHFGIKTDWMNPDNGWYQHRRLEWMIFRRMINEQLANVPKFTELGFKKLTIPKELYKVIVEQSDENFKFEKCEKGVNSVINCHRIGNIQLF